MPSLKPPVSRNYENELDLRQMQVLLMESRSRSGDWRYAHIGELIWGFFMVECHLNPHDHIRLWNDETGRLVGYGMLGEDPSFDWQTLPEYEGTGIEEEALAWAETRLAELRRRDAKRWGGQILSGARRDELRTNSRFWVGTVSIPASMPR